MKNDGVGLRGGAVEGVRQRVHAPGADADEILVRTFGIQTFGQDLRHTNLDIRHTKDIQQRSGNCSKGDFN